MCIWYMWTLLVGQNGQGGVVWACVCVLGVLCGGPSVVFVVIWMGLWWCLLEVSGCNHKMVWVVFWGLSW